MNFKTFAIAAAAAASIAIAAPANAEAAEGFTNSDLVQLVGGKRHGGKHFHGGHGFKKHYGWGFHKPYYHGYHGYYGHGCRYFYKKAKWTGSRYWWKQYKACKYGW